MPFYIAFYSVVAIVVLWYVGRVYYCQDVTMSLAVIPILVVMFIEVYKALRHVFFEGRELAQEIKELQQDLERLDNLSPKK